MSLEIPWTLSHVHTSPSQPFLYHCIASLHCHEGNIFSIVLAQDFLYTGSKSKRIQVRKQPDCTEISCIRDNSDQVHALLAYGRMPFTTRSDCKIRIWKPQGVGSMVGRPMTLSMLLKVLGSKPTECKLIFVAIKLGVHPLN
jgi:hypothetical protein